MKPVCVLFRAAVSAAVLLWGASVFGLECGAAWEWSNPRPQGNDLNGCAYDGTTLLAVGSHGTVLTKTGSTLAVGNVGEPYWLTSVIFSGAKWIAGGTDLATTTPIITTSEDGIVWTTRLAGGVGGVFGLVRGDTLFVAVGYNWEGNQDLVFTSSDGYAWLPTFPGTGHVLTSVAHGNSRFVATSESGVFLTSTNGTSWSQAASFPGLEFTSVTFASGKFVAVGHDWTGGNALFAYSADGLSWTPVYSLPDVDLRSVCFGGGQFFAAGYDWNNRLSTCFGSPDGVTWSVLAELGWGRVKACTYGQGRYETVGEGGLLLWSADGVNWSKSSTGSHTGWRDLAEGLGYFLAVGERGCFTKSVDGTTWDLSCFSDAIHLRGLAFGGGRFVAVGDGGDAKYSSDGAIWFYGASGTTQELLDVASSGSSFVAVGLNGTLITSSDGSLWAPLPSPTANHINGITYGQGIYVAVTDEGDSVLMGPSILLVPTGSTDALHGVAYGRIGGDHRYVAVGEAGRIVTLEASGASWVPRASGVTGDLYGVAYASGLFVAVGWDYDAQAAVLVTSPDGITWTARDPGVGHYMSGAGGGRGLLFALGNAGTLLRTACPPTLSAIAPDKGATAGGTSVVLTGPGLTGIASVAFDGLPATFTEDFEGQVTTLAPAHAEGTVSVAVSNLGGESNALTYTYVRPPAIASVVKKTNPLRLVVTGTDFLNPCSVRINGVDVPTTTWKSETKVVAKSGAALKALLPKGTPVSVTVYNIADAISSAPYTYTR
jgi:hypothetical protein